ncbi:MAG: hypothetical protein ACREJB_02120 [Planctomycetaceae bacterium]
MDYAFKGVGRHCAATETELVPGAPFRSALVQRDGRLERLDYCEAGWPGPPEGCIGHWRGVVPVPQLKPRPLDADALLEFFESLREDLNPMQEKLRYLIALLLVQRRRLSIVGTRRDDDGECLELHGSGGEGPFVVKSVTLSDDETAQLQRELTAQLASL